MARLAEEGRTAEAQPAGQVQVRNQVAGWEGDLPLPWRDCRGTERRQVTVSDAQGSKASGYLRLCTESKGASVWFDLRLDTSIAYHQLGRRALADSLNCRHSRPFDSNNLFVKDPSALRLDS